MYVYHLFTAAVTDIMQQHSIATDFQQCISHISQYITLFIYNTVTRKSILHQPERAKSVVNKSQLFACWPTSFCNTLTTCSTAISTAPQHFSSSSMGRQTVRISKFKNKYALCMQKSTLLTEQPQTLALTKPKCLIRAVIYGANKIKSKLSAAQHTIIYCMMLDCNMLR